MTFKFNIVVFSWRIPFDILPTHGLRICLLFSDACRSIMGRHRFEILVPVNPVTAMKTVISATLLLVTAYFVTTTQLEGIVRGAKTVTMGMLH